MRLLREFQTIIVLLFTYEHIWKHLNSIDFQTDKTRPDPLVWSLQKHNPNNSYNTQNYRFFQLSDRFLAQELSDSFALK